MLWQGEDSEAFGYGVLEPVGQALGVVAMGFDEASQFFLGGGAVWRSRSCAIGADALADCDIRCVMDGVLRQMELAALPDAPPGRTALRAAPGRHDRRR